MDETSLSIGEQDSIVTNKETEGENGAIIVIIKGTESQKVISVLRNISYSK
jgi:hypothetical protein